MASLTSFQLWFLVVGTAWSSPFPEPTDAAVHYNAFDERAVNYKAANLALTLLKGVGGPATSFCYSYLHIPATATSTTTTTTSTVTMTTSTTTVTTTTSVCPAAARALPERAPQPIIYHAPGKAAGTLQHTGPLQLRGRSAFIRLQLSEPCTQDYYHDNRHTTTRHIESCRHLHRLRAVLAQWSRLYHRHNDKLLFASMSFY
ncbi:hypothetical protein BDV96DRAFT_631576 [Lophiotrema nucula]|uniref:Uncharacterized protein n=1 Tax=Lophiotrema nucula TaxID=690887 RepID=A0A6A5Z7Z5_9PLEO|nr:hypothetical protein BDV96DRAFT_631576 [Lophiotrema nucula]